MLPVKNNHNSIPKLLANNDTVLNSIAPAERMIIEYSSKKNISEYEDKELIKKMSAMIEMLLKDIGFSGKLSQVEITRIYIFLKTFYSNMSIAEIKLAFELSLVGKLDSYLPIGKNGNPDKEHYQNFSVAYISKILNAYLSMRSKLFSKSFKILQSKQLVAIPDMSYRQKTIVKYLKKFEEFKSTGNIDLTVVEEHVLFNLLLDYKLVEKIELDEDQKAKAFDHFRLNLVKNINPLERDSVLRKGVEHEKVKVKGERSAMRAEIVRIFSEIKDLKSILV